ncbi:class I SAM-dependent methyltransferase [Candidatus Gracilibacteria bacterium]|nr:class I SAM-dependent methyltransferase [Candidatus Gracilibacteria bacterium]
MSYDAFATTFSNSRKNLHWPELEYIIENIKNNEYRSILDVGCGNGRFLEESEKLGYIPDQYLGVDNSEGMILEARKLHSETHFEVIGMQDIKQIETTYDAIVFLASFHHLETQEERMQVLKDIKKLLHPNGRIYMTNWNLREQSKYEKSHRENGDFDIKIGEFFRYYHGFTLIELEGLFKETEYEIIENRIFEGGRNLISMIGLGI